MHWMERSGNVKFEAWLFNSPFWDQKNIFCARKNMLDAKKNILSANNFAFHQEAYSQSQVL
eukprot:6214903-Karenia_brevis.AAC.1